MSVKKLKGLVISGPTGVGKTNLSIELAKKLGCDIISADSMQVYKEMNIGTAKISKDEMQKQSCLTYAELSAYENSTTAKEFCVCLMGLYGWHISAMQIYDKPKELSEFHKPVMPLGLRYEDDIIKRPPQSWAYVEELEEPCKTKN